MSFRDYVTCQSKACDFEVTFGWDHALPLAVRMGFCKRCLKRVLLDETDSRGETSLPEIRIMKVVVMVEAPPPPSIWKTPGERRQSRKALGPQPKNRGRLPLPEFRATGSELAFDREGKPIKGMEGSCPHCGEVGGIVIGFEKWERCPKCGIGALKFEFWE